VCYTDVYIFLRSTLKQLIESCGGTVIEDCESIETYPIITLGKGSRVVIGEPNARGAVPLLFIIGNPTKFRRLKYMMALAIGKRLLSCLMYQCTMHSIVCVPSVACRSSCHSLQLGAALSVYHQNPSEPLLQPHSGRPVALRLF
jgi:hypothetical protein